MSRMPRLSITRVHINVGARCAITAAIGLAMVHGFAAQTPGRRIRRTRRRLAILRCRSGAPISALDQIKNKTTFRNCELPGRQNHNLRTGTGVQSRGHSAGGRRRSVYDRRSQTERRRHRRIDRRDALVIPVRRRGTWTCRPTPESSRGLDRSDGRGDDRIVYITPGYQLIALNARTGHPVTAFGNNGVVDLYDGLDQPRPPDGQID